MERKQIILEFNKDGTVKVMPRGFTGGECRTATRFIEEALGNVVQSSDTAEAFMTEIVDTDTVRT